MRCSADDMNSWLVSPAVMVRFEQPLPFIAWLNFYQPSGFSAGGTEMLFENNYVQNGDDCLTVGSGAKNIHFRNSYCEGGHGVSIGSLGKGGDVADVQNVLCVVSAILSNEIVNRIGVTAIRIENVIMVRWRCRRYSGLC